MMGTTRRYFDWCFERSRAGQLEVILRRTLAGRRVCLCMHRVGRTRRPGELVPKLTIHPEVLDAIIDGLHEAREDGGRGLTVSFDDGYRDAAEYLISRRERWPDVEWIFFVCPEKTAKRVGFRWDLAEVKRARGEAVAILPMLDEDHPFENERVELRELAERPEFELASLELCQRLSSLPRVRLGNHTNTHARGSRLSPERARAEYRASFRDFESLFGRAADFAFPFGVPGEDFEAAHVEAVRESGPTAIWSTEARPYGEAERFPGALLPRYAVDGTRSWKQTLGWISLQALRARAFGPRWKAPEPAGIPVVASGGLR